MGTPKLRFFLFLLLSLLSVFVTSTLADTAATDAAGGDPAAGGEEDGGEPTYGGYTLAQILEMIRQKKLVDDAQLASSLISICFCFFVMCTYIFIRRFQPELVNRISFRLAIAVTIADFFYAAFQLMLTVASADYIYEMQSPLYGNEYWCRTTMFFYLFSELSSAFLTACISINLLLVFVIKVRDTRKFERWYFIGAVLFAFILAVIPLAASRLGWDTTQCWFRPTLEQVRHMDEDLSYFPEPEEMAQVTYWEAFSFYIWVAICALFCTVTSIAFWVIIRAESRDAAQELDSSITGSDISASITSAAGRSKTQKKKKSKMDSLVHRAVFRIAFYCIIPLLSQAFNIAIDVIYLIESSVGYKIIALANIFSGLQGTFNALIFFTFDPGVISAREALRVWLISKFYLPYVVSGYEQLQGQSITGGGGHYTASASGATPSMTKRPSASGPSDPPPEPEDSMHKLAFYMSGFLVTPKDENAITQMKKSISNPNFTNTNPTGTDAGRPRLLSDASRRGSEKPNTAPYDDDEMVSDEEKAGGGRKGSVPLAGGAGSMLTGGMEFLFHRPTAKEQEALGTL